MKTSRLLISTLAIALLASCNVNFIISHPDDPEKKDTVDNRTPDQKRDLGYLFDLQALPEITLTLSEDEWNRYLNNYDNNQYNRQYVAAQFEFRKGEQVYHRDSVGVRPRGNTSRRRPESYARQPHDSNNPEWHHAHFGVRFTEYTTGERFFGADRIVLKWFNNDPAYCREVFCYDLFRRFGVWSAPRSSYCRLYIYIIGDKRPAYFGVYQMIEGVRKGYLDDRKKDGFLPDDDGNIWKCAYNSDGKADLSDFNSTGKSKMGVATDDRDYSYALKTNKTTGLSAAQQELYDFMEQMRPLQSGSDELKLYLEQHLYVDQFLRALAVNVAVGMWDDYWINANNYYCYFDSQHKFLFIPYDYDNTLGTNGIISNAGTHDPIHWGSRDGDRLLVRKVLSISEYEDTYKLYLKQLVTDTDLMQPDAAISRVGQLQQLVENYVENDTGEDMTVSDKSASWGDIGYRLLSGDNSGEANSNFFRSKAKTINDL